MEAQSGSFFARNEFLIRRLHSLTGLVPVGAFMCVHLITNSSTLGGAEMFQKNVDLIHSLGPALPAVEWAFIFLPLIFHAVVGVWIIRSGESNYFTYNYVSNFRWWMQRVTAWIALFFILYHVFHMHGWFHTEWWLKNVANENTGGHLFKPEHATSSAAIALASPFKKLLYVVGVTACVFHLANGLWTLGITWGIWTSPAAQRRANYLCAAFGVGLLAVGLGSIVGVSKTNVAEAEAVENAQLETKAAAAKRAAELLKKESAKAVTPTATATKK